VSFDPEDLRIEGNPLRVNPSLKKRGGTGVVENLYPTAELWAT
jgi:hypothetical protein